MTVLLLLAVLVLVLLNGFFVAAEFALVRVRRSRIEEEVEDGVKGASLVLTQLEDLSRYLAACQLGITFTSLGIGFLGEPAVATLFEDLFGADVPHWVSLGVSLFLAYLITTSIHITLGEQVPKIYAIQRSEPISRLVARPLYLFTKVFHPFIGLLNAASNGILRLMGIRTDNFDEGETPEEMQRRSAVSTFSETSTVTTAGNGVITWRASCSCRWKTPWSIPASPASRWPPVWAWAMRKRSSSGLEPSSSSACASMRMSRSSVFAAPLRSAMKGRIAVLNQSSGRATMRATRSALTIA